MFWIVSENPRSSLKVQGKLFVLDLSFILWHLLTTCSSRLISMCCLTTRQPCGLLRYEACHDRQQNQGLPIRTGLRITAGSETIGSHNELRHGTLPSLQVGIHLLLQRAQTPETPWGYDESDSRCLELKELIAEQLHLFYDEGVRRFVCGMAAGCDFYFAEEVIRLAREKRGIVLEAAIPFAGQPDSLPTAELKDRYKNILAHCEIQTVLSSHYHSFCMQLRNRYMVDISDKLLAVSAGLVGGTSYTIEYAKRKALRPS